VVGEARLTWNIQDVRQLGAKIKPNRRKMGEKCTTPVRERGRKRGRESERKGKEREELHSENLFS